MRLVWYFLSLLLLFVVPFFVMAQEPACLWKSMANGKVEILLDSMSALESSIVVKNDVGISLPFSYDINTGKIKVEFENDIKDSVLICYQTLPFSFHKVYSNRTLKQHYDSMAFFKEKNEVAVGNFDFREEVFSSDKLNQSGSMTRGISFGNAQNVFVNSSLNLQMDGELADNLFIRASITDQNVPFQPEGNTQQIQDFDNILMELYNDKMNLAGGDVVLKQRQSEFLRYYKNVQGVQYTADYAVKNGWKASTQASASIAKGKFASMPLEILEGVLGPYRIKGPGNERYVIVMANSENVFLDGKPLKRGFSNDYIIDYNQGEITFTPSVLITQYSRVRIDFEYAERNFSRSILVANHIQENEKISFYVNYYREKDDRNRPLFTELSDHDKMLLASVGDNLMAAATPRIDSTGYDPNRILYKKVTAEEGHNNPTIYYEYSTRPEEAFFAISFSETGQGMGDYRRKQQLANGIVYEYVPPVNGEKQGNYSILSTLPAPNKKQMITAGARVKLGGYEQAYTEVAFSDHDHNLFSDMDQQDNKGFAFKSGIISKGREVRGFTDYLLKGTMELEYNSAHFSFIDRFRYIEFDRDWGFGPETLQVNTNEKMARATLEMVKDKNNLFSYGADFRNREGVLSGIQQRAQLKQQIGGRLLLNNDLFHLQSQVNQYQSQWFRYSGEVKYPIKVLVPGYRFSLDRNAVKNIYSDSVVSTAMNFREHRFFLQSSDTLKYSFFGDVIWREDQLPVEGQLIPGTAAFTTNYGINGTFGAHQVKGTFTYRKLSHIWRDLSEETSVMGKMDYQSALFDNNLRNEITYALGNGRELRREFVFLPVPTGDGTHTWRDDNGDGVQQLNEFYLAVNPEEKNYIKVFVPTDEYIQAYTTIFNYRLNAKFPDEWKKTSGMKKWLTKFSNSTNWNVEKKLASKDFFNRISPFTANLPSEELISIRQSFRSSLFFNRSSPKYGFDFSHLSSQHKQLLTGGFEDLLQEDWRLNTRFNFNPQWNLLLLLNQAIRKSASDFLDNRNYRVQQHAIGPELNMQPNPTFRTTLQYKITQKQNMDNLEFEEKAMLQEAALNIRYAKAINTTLNSGFRYTFIDYNGNVNSPIGYEMLQALTPGNNFIWTINWLQKIGEGLQMNMVYEGRNSEGLDRMVHTGRMQVSALF